MSPSGFTAIVPHSTSRSHCEIRPSELGGEGGRAITLVHEGPDEQRLTVIVDYEGVPVLYTDVRGDVSPSDDEVGDRTAIELHLTEGFALASNRSARQAPVVFEMPLAEATVSENLGYPGMMLEHVLEECRVAAPG